MSGNIKADRQKCFHLGPKISPKLTVSVAEGSIELPFKEGFEIVLPW